MNYLGRLFSSAQDYYRSINGANLTGAIDVIVIEKENGDYESTPFYVRFGKMGVLYPGDQLVEIDINGQSITDLYMRVGRTGFAYFHDLYEQSLISNAEAASDSSSLQESVPHHKHRLDTSDDMFDLELHECDKSEINDRGIHLSPQISPSFTKQPSITFSSDENVAEPTTFSLKSFISYLQDIGNWPNEFYIYQITNKSENKNNKKNNLTSSNQHLKTQANPASPSSFTQCELLFPNSLNQLSDTVSFDSIWVVWSGSCMSGQTAATCLLSSVSEYEKDLLLKADAKHSNHHLVLNKYKMDQGSVGESDLSFGQSSTNRRGWCWWRSNRNDTVLSIDRTVKSNQHVQPLLAPINLGVASPIYSPDENESIPNDSNPTDLMRVDVTPKALYASTNNLSRSPDTQQSSSSPDEAGYFSDEADNTAVYKKHSKRIECEISQEMRHLSSDNLKKLNLHNGANEAVFTVVSKYQGTCQCACFIYFWTWSDKIVITDIDGTITKSDWLGQIMPLVGMDWTHSHIVQIYDKIARNGYRFIYLSSRPIGQARATRRFLHAIQQGSYHLPDGPILLSPFSVLEAFHKEVILRKANEFKTQCLMQVRDLFSGPKTNDDQQQQFENQPFVAGFGNRTSDVITYKTIGLQNYQIFTVNYLGSVICGDATEELMNAKKWTKQKTDHTTESSSPSTDLSNSSTNSIKFNLDSLLQMVDAYFPQAQDRLPYAATCSDYTFWKT